MKNQIQNIHPNENENTYDKKILPKTYEALEYIHKWFDTIYNYSKTLTTVTEQCRIQIENEDEDMNPTPNNEIIDVAIAQIFKTLSTSNLPAYFSATHSNEEVYRIAKELDTDMYNTHSQCIEPLKTWLDTMTDASNEITWGEIIERFGQQLNSQINASKTNTMLDSDQILPYIHQIKKERINIAQNTYAQLIMAQPFGWMTPITDTLFIAMQADGIDPI